MSADLATDIAGRAAFLLEQHGWTPQPHVDLSTGAISYTQALIFAAGGAVGAGHDYADEPDQPHVRAALHRVEADVLERVGVPTGSAPAGEQLATWEAHPGRTAEEVFAVAGVHLDAARRLPTERRSHR
jgi:hypothetical protein